MKQNLDGLSAHSRCIYLAVDSFFLLSIPEARAPSPSVALHQVLFAWKTKEWKLLFTLAQLETVLLRVFELLECQTVDWSLGMLAPKASESPIWMTYWIGTPRGRALLVSANCRVLEATTMSQDPQGHSPRANCTSCILIYKQYCHCQACLNGPYFNTSVSCVILRLWDSHNFQIIGSSKTWSLITQTQNLLRTTRSLRIGSHF